MSAKKVPIRKVTAPPVAETQTPAPELGKPREVADLHPLPPLVPLTTQETEMVRRLLSLYLPTQADVALVPVCDALGRGLIVIAHDGTDAPTVSIEKDLSYSPDNIGVAAARHGGFLQVLNAPLHVHRYHMSLGA